MKKAWIFGLVLGVYAVELLLAMTQWHLPWSTAFQRAKIARSSGLVYDLRSTGEMLTAMGAQEPIKPLITPGQLLSQSGEEEIPLATFADTRVLACNESGQYFSWHTDEYGFHNPRGLYQAPVDVVILGGGFAMGACVSDEQDLGSLVRAVYPKTVNLGMVGSGPLLCYATFLDYGAALRPKKTVWVVSESEDFSQLTRELAVLPLKRYLDQSSSSGRIPGFLGGKSDPTLSHFFDTHRHEVEQDIQPYATMIPNTVHRMLVLSNLRYGLERLFVQEPIAMPRPELKQIFEQAKSHVAGWGGELVVVFLPSAERYLDEQSALVLDQATRRVEEDLNDLGIRFLNFGEVVETSGDPLSFYPFRCPGHYTAEGYQKLARWLVQHLDLSTD